MLPDGRQLTPRLVAIALADIAALAVLLGGKSSLTLSVGFALHLALCLAAYIAQPAGSRRVLATAWMVSFPGLGLPVASLTMQATAAGELQEFQRGQLPERKAGPAQVVRLIAGHVPVCERLVSGVSRTRRTALNSLAARRDAEALEILRWAVRHPDSELALDAALTLDELVGEFEERRTEALDKLANGRTFENLVEAGDVLVDALWTRLVDDTMVVALADEATWHFQHARSVAPERADELTERLAKLALITMRPHEALRLLRPSMHEKPTSRTVHALYNQAVATARRFSTTHPEVHDAVA